MPVYQTPLRGVAQSVAHAEAAAIARITVAMLWAYELWHPSMAEPIYFVNDRADLSATIEATAARNPNTVQNFIGVLLNLQRPEESDTASTPELTLTREGVSGILSDAFKASRGSLVPWVLIERCYASDDTSGPAKLPVAEYELSGNTLTGAGAAIRATFADHANVSVPRLTFRREKYSGLA